MCSLESIAVLHQAGDESNFPGLSRGVGQIVMDFVADGNLIGVLEPIVGKFYWKGMVNRWHFLALPVIRLSSWGQEKQRMVQLAALQSQTNKAWGLDEVQLRVASPAKPLQITNGTCTTLYYCIMYSCIIQAKDSWRETSMPMPACYWTSSLPACSAKGLESREAVHFLHCSWMQHEQNHAAKIWWYAWNMYNYECKCHWE